MKIIMSQWLNRWWWLIALPIIVQLLLGITLNIVYLYTSFITIFLILPPAFLFLYYFYALTTEARISIQNKHLEFKEDGITIVFESETEETPLANPIFIEKEKVTSLYSGVKENKPMSFNMAYYPDINYFAGRESVQMVMQYYC